MAKEISRETAEVIDKLRDAFVTYRKEADFTQLYLAKKSGISSRTLQNFEAGKDITLNNLVSLMLAMEIDLDLASLIPPVPELPDYAKK